MSLHHLDMIVSVMETSDVLSLPSFHSSLYSLPQSKQVLNFSHFLMNLYKGKLTCRRSLLSLWSENISLEHLVSSIASNDHLQNKLRQTKHQKQGESWRIEGSSPPFQPFSMLPFFFRRGGGSREAECRFQEEKRGNSSKVTGEDERSSRTQQNLCHIVIVICFIFLQIVNF